MLPFCCQNNWNESWAMSWLQHQLYSCFKTILFACISFFIKWIFVFRKNYSAKYSFCLIPIFFPIPNQSVLINSNINFCLYSYWCWWTHFESFQLTLKSSTNWPGQWVLVLRFELNMIASSSAKAFEIKRVSLWRFQFFNEISNFHAVNISAIFTVKSLKCIWFRRGLVWVVHKVCNIKAFLSAGITLLMHIIVYLVVFRSTSDVTCSTCRPSLLHLLSRDQPLKFHVTSANEICLYICGFTPN